METVHASWQKNANIIGLKLHEANRASCTHILSFSLQLMERFLHIQYSGPLFLLQILIGGQQGLSHESVNLSTGIGEEHEHEKGNKQQVDSNDDDEVILADVIKRQVILCGVKLLEQFAEDEDHANDDGEFIVKGFLVVHEPAIEDDDVVQADAVGGHSAEVDHVLAQSVLVPVRDGEDQQRKRDERLDDARQVLLDHRYEYKRIRPHLIQKEWIVRAETNEGSSFMMAGNRQPTSFLSQGSPVAKHKMINNGKWYNTARTS